MDRQRMGQYHWLVATLAASGYHYNVAAVIAHRFLLGQTLFSNEVAAAHCAIATLSHTEKTS
jgi:hypothetical protein